MNYDEVIQRLKESAEMSRTVHSHLLGDNVPPELRRSVEALEIAADAVGKQIPKPIEIRFRNGYILPAYYCPDCGELIGDAFRYKHFGVFCTNCGQRLSFGEARA